MTEFEGKFFTKFKFTGEQVVRYFQNALRDLSIARDDKHIEVKFNYAFNALIKAGIALMAAKGVKIRSVPGHHVKLIEKTAEILGDESIATLGNSMRMKRNEDFYGGGIFVSEKECREYLEFVEETLEKIKKEIHKNPGRTTGIGTK